VCREKVCSRRTFTEQIPARVRITGRARRSCERAVADGRRLTWKMRGRRGRAGDEEWDHRRLLRSNAENLTAEQIQTLERDLTRAGTYGKQILAGWKAKEKLRAVLALARTPAVRSQVSHRWHDFLAWWADHAHLPELATLAESLQAWWNDRGVHHHRDQQRQTRRTQPRDQARSPTSVRLPQPHQPTTPITLRNHQSQPKPSPPRLNSKTRHECWEKENPVPPGYGKPQKNHLALRVGGYIV
jgi:hypothetical protein